MINGINKDERQEMKASLENTLEIYKQCIKDSFMERFNKEERDNKIKFCENKVIMVKALIRKL